MATQQSPPSQYPPSMGPGARPTASGGDLAQEIWDIRRSYSVSDVDSGLKLEYKLRDKHRSFTIPYDKIPFSSFICAGRFFRTGTGIFMIDSIRGAENITGITMNQSQAEGFAEHASKVMVWGSIGNIASLGLAAGLWRQGRQTMKFPFRSVKDPERYQRFPNRYLPIIKGPWARALWQFTRYNTYLLLGILFLTPVFRSVGTSSMTVGLYRDDRTRAILENMKQIGFQRHLANRKSSSYTGTAPQADDQQQSESMDGSYGEDTTAQSAMQDGYTNSSSEDTKPAPERTIESTPRRNRYTRWEPRPNSPAEPQADTSRTPSANDSNDPFAFNDPSTDPNSPQYNPSAATSSRSPQQQQFPPQRSWASIRNEARRSNPQQQQQQQQQSQGHYPGADASSAGNASAYGSNSARPEARRPASSEGYGYGNATAGGAADGEKEKEKAQKEFDALLERERRMGEGGGDGSGSGSGGMAGGLWKRR